MTAQVEILPTTRDGQMGALLQSESAALWVPESFLRDAWAKVRQAQTDRALDQMEEEQGE